MRTPETANCFDCRKAPHFLDAGGNNLCPIRELAEARSKLESHHCPAFVPIEGLRLHRQKKQAKILAEREFALTQESLF